MSRITRTLFLLLLSTVLLAACRGSDETDISEPQFPLTNNPNTFNSFLNLTPGVPRDGVAEGDIDNVQKFPEAYYNTIDPDKTRDTFDKWREANGFINADGTEAACDPDTCRQSHVKFRDTKDLGYGRNMFMHWNTVTDDIAIYVENFNVETVPGVAYGDLNFEALVNNDRRWNVSVNAIEFSAFPATGVNAQKFTKFYNFAGDGIDADGPTGSRKLFVDLDEHGNKPMPNACIVCHGGRGETLVVKASDGTYVLAPTQDGGIAGDLQAQLQTIEFDTLQLGKEAGFTGEDNAEGIRLINQAVLASYEYRKSQFTQSSDWLPDLAIDTLKGRYAGDPGNPANQYDSAFVPAGWSTDQNSQNLYRSLMAPNCLVCHALRGSIANSSAAFPALSGFRNYSARVDHLIFEQGKMPLSLLNYSDFWDHDNKDPALMAAVLGLASRIDANQKAFRPGAPVAVISAPPVATGIDAAGTSLDIAITGSGSAFATVDGQRWEVSPADTATVTPEGPMGDAVLRVSAAGTYTLTLTVDGIHGGSNSSTQIILVLNASDAGAPPAGADIRFFGTGGINELLTQQTCNNCHIPGAASSPPVFFTACRSDDFNGNEFLYRSVLARVNFDSPLDSLFLRKPTNGSTDPGNRAGSVIAGYHAGGDVFTINNADNPLEADAEYSSILSWILNGAPSGTIPVANTIPAGAQSCT